MFLHSYQSGPFFEIFDPKEVQNKANKEKAELYQKLFKINYPTKSQISFDQVLKGFIFEFEGHSTKLQFPRKGDLGLIQQFLIIQTYLHPGYNWTLELEITDITKTKRRVVLTDSVKTLEQHHFHLKSPIDHIRRGQWLNLCIDVWSFMEGFKGCTFRSIDAIIIGSPCKLRKIYLMKNPIEDSEIEITFTQGFMAVPKQVNFPEWFPHNNQLITFRLLNFNEFSLSQQIQSIPDNPIDKYVYDQKSHIQPSTKIGQLKYSKPEYNQQEFKKYETKNQEEKLTSQDQSNLDSDSKDHPSYFQEVQQEEQLEDFMAEIDQDDEYLKLVYDPQLKCFYDPETNEYYQLNQE